MMLEVVGDITKKAVVKMEITVSIREEGTNFISEDTDENLTCFSLIGERAFTLDC